MTLYGVRSLHGILASSVVFLCCHTTFVVHNSTTLSPVMLNETKPSRLKRRPWSQDGHVARLISHSLSWFKTCRFKPKQGRRKHHIPPQFAAAPSGSLSVHPAMPNLCFPCCAILSRYLFASPVPGILAIVREQVGLGPTVACNAECPQPSHSLTIQNQIDCELQC